MSSHTFSFNISINDRPATVRGLLSTISSVYVPLGFVAPFILMADVIPQDLCRKKLDWDNHIPDKDLRSWQTWLCKPLNLGHFHIEQCLKPCDFGEVTSCHLHFSDASQCNCLLVGVIEVYFDVNDYKVPAQNV